ncbi:MAG: F0F1 ATP synthase subunit A [Candidatus Gastranaerophilaceae bacterium]|nr:F0F1 ATP synthase subunit A [Candidatus Gastranaerophilaceae bacterium]
MEHWIYVFHILGHKISVNLDTVFTMWFAMISLLIFAFIATRKLSIIPNKLQAACEGLMNFFWGLMDSMMPADNRKHVPLVASLFLFILFANLMGQLPLRIIHLKEGELASPTNDINMTAAMAVIVLIYYVTAGIIKKKHKFLLKDFSFVSIIMMFVDLLEMITRPLSLAIRLFANIFAGEVLVSIALAAYAYFAPLPVMLFEILVAFIQATVFMMLTMAYIGGATGEEH